jgi:N12 class adenine-specific DNA methylase
MTDPETGEEREARLRCDDGDRTTRKRIEAIKERLSEGLESIKDRRDDMVTIEEIGIDQVIVDEAQEFRYAQAAVMYSSQVMRAAWTAVRNAWRGGTFHARCA